MEDRMSNHISKITFGFLTLINLLLFIIYGELKLMHAAIFSGTLIWLHFCITTFFSKEGEYYFGLVSMYFDKRKISSKIAFVTEITIIESMYLLFLYTHK